MAKKKLTERGLGQVQLNTLIEYYLSDMQRRGCIRDSVVTNRSAVSFFHVTSIRTRGKLTSKPWRVR